MTYLLMTGIVAAGLLLETLVLLLTDWRRYR
jgi:hypothetical protein